MPRLTKEKWKLLRSEWECGIYSNRVLANMYSVSERAIRLKARNPEDLWKRHASAPPASFVTRSSAVADRPNSAGAEFQTIPSPTSKSDFLDAPGRSTVLLESPDLENRLDPDMEEWYQNIWNDTWVNKNTPVRLLKSAGIPHNIEASRRASWEAAVALVICESFQQFKSERRISRKHYEDTEDAIKALQRLLDPMKGTLGFPLSIQSVLPRVRAFVKQCAADAPPTNKAPGYAKQALAANGIRLFMAAFSIKPTVYINGAARRFLSKLFELTAEYARDRGAETPTFTDRTTLGLLRPAINEVTTKPLTGWQQLLGLEPKIVDPFVPISLDDSAS